MITLVLGGTRSGKSEIAERLALRQSKPILYFATGAPSDDGMQERIARHRARRGDRFCTIETGGKLAEALRAEPAGNAALIDSLGTWVAAHDGFAADVAALLGALRARTGPTVIVSDEVGLGVHPSTEVGNRFRDALGEVNRAVAGIADEVVLVVAGRVLPLEHLDPFEPTDDR